jgi:hypothetical protein
MILIFYNIFPLNYTNYSNFHLHNYYLIYQLQFFTVYTNVLLLQVLQWLFVAHVNRTRRHDDDIPEHF